MYQFDQPQYFYLLLLLPLLALLYLALLAWRQKVQKNFGDSHLLQQLAPMRSRTKGMLKFALSLLILAFLSLALVNPKVGTRLESVQREGIDLVFAVDVSKSMLAEDVQPNRLERAKLLISNTLDELVGDRVGIITYAGKAYPQLPITTDYGAARLFLKNINTDLIPSQGTAIAEALELSTQFFDDEGQKNRLLVIISDGEDHEEKLDKAIAQVHQAGIEVISIGLGTERGGPIPVYRGKQRISYKKNQSGEVVITKRNNQTLQKIAGTSGEVLNGNRSRGAVTKIQEKINSMEKQQFEAALFTDYEDQFQWLLLPALLLLILDVLILERKTLWFQKLKLFDRHAKNR